MIGHLNKHFRKILLTPYELQQRQRTLTIMLWMIIFIALALGLVNLSLAAWEAALSLFGLALICVPALWWNKKGKYFISACLISVMILFVTSFNLYDGGGLHDPGVMSYPIFVILGSLIFGKRATPIFYLASITSLSLITYFEINGYFIPDKLVTDIDNLITLSILVTASAVLIWIIMENNENNLERLKQSEAELHKAYNLTLEGFVKVIEYRDRETEGHSRRVTDLSLQLAEELGCNTDEIVHIRRGALLHDLGKLAIPDHILHKKEPLTKEELKIIQQHPTYAMEILTDISFLQPAICIPYCHHERWDGTGYPQGLKGEEIPLPARIFAIVDHWEALTSDRPYRKAWPRDKIISYIRNNAGKIFDPQIVEVFLRIV